MIDAIYAGVIFHLLIIMLLWSLIRTVISDPGKVPAYWGNFSDDPESNKRRYCLSCHIFKPERCHHCSTCKRCVLNMDHHCPWINNCVGYQNRKFFILMLFYINITSFFLLITEFSQFIDIISNLIFNNSFEIMDYQMTIKLISYFCLFAF